MHNLSKQLDKNTKSTIMALSIKFDTLWENLWGTEL